MLDVMIDTLLAVPLWLRLLAAVAVALPCGAGVHHAIRAAGREPDGPQVELRQLRHLVRALRFLLVGGSALLLAAGAVRDDRTLVGLALIIGLEELYETTMVLALLRMGLRMERAHDEAATDPACTAPA